MYWLEQEYRSFVARRFAQDWFVSGGHIIQCSLRAICEMKIPYTSAATDVQNQQQELIAFAPRFVSAKPLQQDWPVIITSDLDGQFDEALDGIKVEFSAKHREMRRRIPLGNFQSMMKIRFIGIPEGQMQRLMEAYGALILYDESFSRPRRPYTITLSPLATMNVIRRKDQRWIQRWTVIIYRIYSCCATLIHKSM